MSATACKRDPRCFKTILDFAQAIQSPESKKKLLLVRPTSILARLGARCMEQLEAAWVGLPEPL